MSEQIKKIDPNSEEFQTELQKTVDFTDKVVKQFGFAYNPDSEITQSIQFGLTRNKLIYDKRYCPCFFVTGNKEEDRVCPCKPAINDEIPNHGSCHCGIFCTPEFAAAKSSRYLEFGTIGNRSVLFTVIKTPLFAENEKPCWNTHTYLVGTATEETIVS